MMTSRAEYRLLLRQDNADIRLSAIGHEVGLIDDERYARLLKKEELIAKEIERVNHVNLGTSEAVQKLLRHTEVRRLHHNHTGRADPQTGIIL